MELVAQYELAMATDLFSLIIDQDQGRFITNDAASIVQRLNADVDGIGRCRLYYRDTDGRFDELRVVNGLFAGFGPWVPHQQEAFSDWFLADDTA